MTDLCYSTKSKQHNVIYISYLGPGLFKVIRWFYNYNEIWEVMSQPLLSSHKIFIF